MRARKNINLNDERFGGIDLGSTSATNLLVDRAPVAGMHTIAVDIHAKDFLRFYKDGWLINITPEVSVCKDSTFEGYVPGFSAFSAAERSKMEEFTNEEMAEPYDPDTGEIFDEEKIMNVSQAKVFCSDMWDKHSKEFRLHFFMNPTLSGIHLLLSDGMTNTLIESWPFTDFTKKEIEDDAILCMSAIERATFKENAHD